MSGKSTLGSRFGQTKKGGEKLNCLNKWTGQRTALLLPVLTPLINEVIEQENLHRTQCRRSDAAAYAARMRANCVELQNVKMRTLFIVIDNVGTESI